MTSLELQLCLLALSSLSPHAFSNKQTINFCGEPKNWSVAFSRNTVYFLHLTHADTHTLRCFIILVRVKLNHDACVYLLRTRTTVEYVCVCPMHTHIKRPCVIERESMCIVTLS